MSKIRALPQAGLPGKSPHKSWFYEQVRGIMHVLNRQELARRKRWLDVAEDFGADPTGRKDSTAAIQAAIDEASAQSVRGVVFMPPGTYLISEPLEIYNAVTLEGAAGAGKWSDEPGGAILSVADGASIRAIIVGGTADSFDTSNGFQCVDGVELRNFAIRGQTDNNGIGGVLVDASNTLFADRGFARDVLIDNVNVFKVGGHAFEVMGNAFNIRLHNCGGFLTVPDVDAFKTTTATVNSGNDAPGQIFVYDSHMRSGGLGGWCYNVNNTHIFGGHAEGRGGISLSSNCGVWGTHVEGDENADSVGLRLVGRYNTVFLSTIGRFETGVQIGNGTATSADRYFGRIGIIQIGTTGVHITSGGARSGILQVNAFASLTGSSVVDDRGSGEYKDDFFAIRQDDIAYLQENALAWGGSDGTDEFKWDFDNATETLTLGVRRAGGTMETKLTVVGRTNTPLFQWDICTHRMRIEHGVTGSRPASPATGQMYFDTTLGMPIWYDGTNWVDATGTTA